MDVFLTIVLYVTGLAMLLIGFVGVLVPILPGGPLMFLGVLAIAGADRFERIGVRGLVATALIAAAMVAVDYLASLVGARRYGASRWGLLGAIVGLLAAVPFGVVGLVFGPIAGAMLFEYAKDPDFRKATRVGGGTLVGFVLGTAVKYALACALLGLTALLWLF